MAEGFITRKGGAVGTKAPTLNFVSKTFEEIVFTITNNEPSLTVEVFWELADDTPDQNVVTLTGGETSENITLDNLNEETTYTVFAFANSATKAGSDTVSLTQTTPAEPITYIDATGGTTTTYEDNGTFYKSHTFLSSGNFVVNSLSNQGSTFNQVDYLIIAGGGGGGSNRGGGGGAGGYRTTLGTSGANSTAESKITVTAQTYGITIGAGGAGGTFTDTDQLAGSRGVSGNNSSVFGVSSTGGGGGGTVRSGLRDGLAGGSGGGGSLFQADGLGGAGTAAQGFAGGRGRNSPPPQGGGGGGGASQAGINASSSGGGKGGDGLANTLRTGSAETRAGGGGGGTRGDQNGVAGAGGSGGGGTGSINFGSNATINTGSGGGGGGEGFTSTGASGGNGGSGIVVIRYEVGAL